jgi:hypothetical protein
MIYLTIFFAKGATISKEQRGHIIDMLHKEYEKKPMDSLKRLIDLFESK